MDSNEQNVFLNLQEGDKRALLVLKIQAHAITLVVKVVILPQSNDLLMSYKWQFPKQLQDIIETEHKNLI